MYYNTNITCKSVILRKHYDPIYVKNKKIPNL